MVPDTAPETKLANIHRLGAEYVKVPFAEFEETFVTRQRAGMKGLLVHPFSDPAVMAGNGTIGLEILEDLPDVDANRRRLRGRRPRLRHRVRRAGPQTRRQDIRG